jgi:hypothetical protein
MTHFRPAGEWKISSGDGKQGCSKVAAKPPGSGN